jgi:hypothetical protein
MKFININKVAWFLKDISFVPIIGVNIAVYFAIITLFIFVIFYTISVNNEQVILEK